MSRTQWIAIAITTANLALLLMFPPYDYLSIQRGNVATFDGFYFAIGSHHNRIINADFLTLEIIVVLINSAIAWLLLRPKPILDRSTFGGNRNQRLVLTAIGVNLMVMLLFPPFENFTAITKAALPTFEGFFFIFGDNTNRQIVAPILYLEFALTLINGGLLWLLLKDRSQKELSAQQIREMAQRIQRAQKA
jgi:hypothetical protein